MKRILILPQLKYTSVSRLLEKIAAIPSDEQGNIDATLKEFLKL
jgi:hypothetical protein